MKPHEEEWKIVDGTAIRAKGFRVARFRTQVNSPVQAEKLRKLTSKDVVEADYARARLAAQAPAMARLLLKMVKEQTERDDPDYGVRAMRILSDAGVLP